MTVLLAIIRHELNVFFRDRRAWLLLFVIPIGIGSFMGALTGGMGTGGTGKGSRLPLLLVDEDDSTMSRRVLAGFAADPQFAVTVTNQAAARELILKGQRAAGILLPAGFGENALPGLFNPARKPVITIFHDPSRSLERQMVEGLLVPKVLSAIVPEFTPENGRRWIRLGLTNLQQNAGDGRSTNTQRLYREVLEKSDAWLAHRAATRGSPPTDATNTAPAGGDFALPLPFSTRAEALTNRRSEYNGYAHSFAGMGLQFVLMSMIDLALSLLRERDSGVFRRLRSLPLARSTLLAGKVLAWTLIALLSFTGCFAFAMVVFGVRIHGSWLGFGGLLIASSLLAATLGLLLAAVGKTPAGARGLAILVVLLLVMIGGAWIPAFLFPSWLQTISLAAPTRWAVDGLDAMTWRGLGYTAAIQPIAILLGFSAFFGWIGYRRFKWDAE